VVTRSQRRLCLALPDVKEDVHRLCWDLGMLFVDGTPKNEKGWW